MVAVLHANGSLWSEQRYLPFGQIRTDIGLITQTDFGYTGQRNSGYTGLMDYNARIYDAALGRFLQPDSIVPGMGNSQNLNRYAYVLNSPIGNIDSSGHYAKCVSCMIVTQAVDSFMQFIGRTFVYEGDKANSLGELMTRAFFSRTGNRNFRRRSK